MLNASTVLTAALVGAATGVLTEVVFYLFDNRRVSAPEDIDVPETVKGK